MAPKASTPVRWRGASQAVAAPSAIAFVTIALAVFFFVIKPINVLTARFSHEETPEPTERKCPFCLMDVPIKARRCAFCTSELGAA